MVYGNPRAKDFLRILVDLFDVLEALRIQKISHGGWVFMRKLRRNCGERQIEYGAEGGLREDEGDAGTLFGFALHERFLAGHTAFFL